MDLGASDIRVHLFPHTHRHTHTVYASFNHSSHPSHRTVAVVWRVVPSGPLSIPKTLSHTIRLDWAARNPPNSSTPHICVATTSDNKHTILTMSKFALWSIVERQSARAKAKRRPSAWHSGHYSSGAQSTRGDNEVSPSSLTWMHGFYYLDSRCISYIGCSLPCG